MVISLVIQRRDQGYSWLARVLVDTGASVDILYWDAFLNLRLQEEDLRPAKTLIKGFIQGGNQRSKSHHTPCHAGGPPQTNNHKCHIHGGTDDLMLQCNPRKGHTPCFASSNLDLPLVHEVPHRGGGMHNKGVAKTCWGVLV